MDPDRSTTTARLSGCLWNVSPSMPEVVSTVAQTVTGLATVGTLLLLLLALRRTDAAFALQRTPRGCSLAAAALGLWGALVMLFAVPLALTDPASWLQMVQLVVEQVCHHAMDERLITHDAEWLVAGQLNGDAFLRERGLVQRNHGDQ